MSRDHLVLGIFDVGGKMDMSYNFPRVELISAGGFPRTSFHYFKIENFDELKAIHVEEERNYNKIEGGHGEW